MTMTHPSAARIVHHESALAILIARRNVRPYRAETRHCIRMHCSAVRVLRSVV